jgi:hypothetical protein
MENMIQAIKEAEEKAAATKQAANMRASEILTLAEKKAAETEKTAREVCKAYKSSQARIAVEAAEAEYASVIAQKSAEAKAKSEEQMENVGATVARIVGRIVSGDC